VQVDSIKLRLKTPEIKLLILKCDEPLSNFAFKSNLRRFDEALQHNISSVKVVKIDVEGRGLHSSTLQLNLSRFIHTSSCPLV
jgi:hypothetical protein